MPDYAARQSKERVNVLLYGCLAGLPTGLGDAGDEAPPVPAWVSMFTFLPQPSIQQYASRLEEEGGAINMFYALELLRMVGNDLEKRMSWLSEKCEVKLGHVRTLALCIERYEEYMRFKPTDVEAQGQNSTVATAAEVGMVRPPVPMKSEAREVPIDVPVQAPAAVLPVAPPVAVGVPVVRADMRVERKRAAEVDLRLGEGERHVQRVRREEGPGEGMDIDNEEEEGEVQGEDINVEGGEEGEAGVVDAEDVENVEVGMVVVVKGRHRTWHDHRAWILAVEENAHYRVKDQVAVYYKGAKKRVLVEGIVEAIEGGMVTVSTSSDTDGPCAYEPECVSLGRWGQLPLAGGIVRWRDYVLHFLRGRDDVGDALPTHPARRWLGVYHQVYCRVFSEALHGPEEAEALSRRKGVQGLLDVCADLGIQVVMVDAKADSVVHFWTGALYGVWTFPGEQARCLGEAGWECGPQPKSLCQVFIAKRYIPTAHGGEGQRWQECRALSGLHDEALAQDSDRRVHGVRRRGPRRETHTGAYTGHLQ